MTTETKKQDGAIAQILSDWLSAQSHSTRYFHTMCCGGVYDILHFERCGVCGNPLKAPEELRACIDKIREVLQDASTKR